MSAPPAPTVSTVHPRERGESGGGAGRAAAGEGPSPRARGIHDVGPHPLERRGSIPASAGNPASRPGPRCGAGVHPRERGESASIPGHPLRAEGPSPRARGIHLRCRRADLEPGSIPASAGNPGPHRAARATRRVHPRERGESSPPAARPHTSAGPSPRARGIRAACSAWHAAQGSIPASAGNPTSHDPSRRSTWVHPRERGESRIRIRIRIRKLGPSPRARGIPRRLVCPHGLPGSIPASAGNPGSESNGAPCRRVHPRERGESGSSSPAPRTSPGPSPRARGILRSMRTTRG